LHPFRSKPIDMGGVYRVQAVTVKMSSRIVEGDHYYVGRIHFGAPVCLFTKLFATAAEHCQATQHEPDQEIRSIAKEDGSG
jgi:hypothetical protein